MVIAGAAPARTLPTRWRRSPGAVGPSPIGTLLANLGDDVAFHVPSKAGKDGAAASEAVTYRGAEALERLHAGFGRGSLRSLDVPLNPVFAISQRGRVNPFNPTEEDKAIVAGAEQLASRTVGIVVRDHLRSVVAERAVPRPRDQGGPAR